MKSRRCKHCGAKVQLISAGSRYRWVTDMERPDETWRCRAGIAHSSVPKVKRSKYEGYDPIRTDDVEELP